MGHIFFKRNCFGTKEEQIHNSKIRAEYIVRQQEEQNVKVVNKENAHEESYLEITLI